MKKNTFLFAFFLSLFGGTQAWADTLTENFNSLTVSGTALSNGWFVQDATLGTQGSSNSNWGNYYYELASRDEDGTSGKSLIAAYGSQTGYVIIPVELTGEISFKIAATKTSNGEYSIHSVTKEGNTYTVNSTPLKSGTVTKKSGSVSFGTWTTVSYTYESHSMIALSFNKAAIDNFSAEKYEEITGPALVVKDGSTKLTTGYAYDFGLTTEGTEKVFTLSNPGTESVNLSVSETGSFGATLSSTSIPAGGEVTLTITMPATTGNSTVTISSTTDGIDDFVINVSGTIRDPNKVYLDFSDGTIPDGWTSVAMSYSSSTYEWKASTGYISTSYTWGSSYAYAFVSPSLSFSENEPVFFETAKHVNSGSCSITFEYSTDGSSWTPIGSAYTNDIYDTWTKRSVLIPTASAKYIRFNAYNMRLRNIYGGELPLEPKLTVTQPASLDFGLLDKDATPATKTFTIANTGRATLNGISVTSANAAFTVTGAPSSLAAGASQEVTITMATGTTGALSSLITVSATDMEDATFTVSGIVMPAGAFVVDFNDNALPSGWSAPSWSFASGFAGTTGYSAIYMTTPKLTFADTDYFVFKVKASDSGSGDYVTVEGSTDVGTSWSELASFTYNNGDFGNVDADYTTVVVSGIPSTVNMIRFKGYYVRIDDIAGLTYAPVLSVTKDAAAVTTPADYDFGECGANASVTYNFANTGAGTINITNVAITGDGAAAYSTNWSASVAAPFDLVITRAYDAARAGAAQDAVVTVTTSEGDFVINVTGTDLAADAPTMGVTLGGAAVATGAAADFGTKLKAAPAAKTYTITNTGTGTLTGTIATSDDTKFTVSKTSFSLAASESTSFDLALVFDTSYGDKAATITIHPTVAGLEDIVINATASTMDPETWEEDFEGGMPTSFISNGWTVSTPGSYSGGNGTKMAGGNSKAATLISPRLLVSEGQTLAFDLGGAGSSYPLTVEFSTDRSTWNTIESYTEDGSKTITATAAMAGYIYLRFTGWVYIDNILGFKLAPLAHDAAITAQSIPTTGNQYVDYTATVTVKEMAGKAESGVVAKLYVDGAEKASDTKDLTANGTATFTMTFTPDAAIDAKKAYIKVTYEDVELTTDEIDLTIAAATVLNEAEGEATLATGTMPSVVVKYTPAAGWGTITMPFALTSDIMTSIFGEGWKAYELKGFTDNTLSFESTTTFYAGYPYIVYVETPAVHADGVILKNVYFSRATAQGDTYGEATFQGTYAPMAAGTMEGKWGVTDEAKIAKGTADASMKGFRGYFTLPDGASARLAFTDEDGTTTVINALELNQNVEGVYNLQGQKVERMQKGLYIVNGRKVVRK